MTDHLPLCHLNKLNNLQGRLQRWLWDMSEVRHTIKYVPGKANKLVDSISRIEYLRAMLTELPKAFNNMTIRNEIYKDYLKLYQEEDSEWLRKKVELAMCGNTQKQKNIKLDILEEEHLSVNKKMCAVQTRNTTKSTESETPCTTQVEKDEIK